MKRLLIISPKNKAGKPARERTLAFVAFFEENGISCEVLRFPSGPFELFKLIWHVYKSGYKNVLVTMPPFRAWSLCFLPGVNTILDIRDGWSIAIGTGYGGTTKPARLRAAIAKSVEKIAINHVALTIACTPGLVEHLDGVAERRKVKLITNGYSQTDFDLVQKLRANIPCNASSLRTFVCAGQFAEYGIEKAKRLIDRLWDNYGDDKSVLKLIGSDPESNRWVIDYVKRYPNLEAEILPRMSRPELFTELLNSDMAILLIRDPQYDFGTKIFDYILCGIPVFDYFDERNAFSDYFSEYLNTAIDHRPGNSESHSRQAALKAHRDTLLKAIA